MKKLLLILSLIISATVFAATVTITAKAGGATITAPASKLYDVIQKGYKIQDEATLLDNMRSENYSLTKNTVAISPTTYTSITYTDKTLTVATTSPDAVTVKAALAKAKIGSIIETAHSPYAQGIVTEINGSTFVVNGWYNSTTTVAITPSPTTATAFYINDWKDQSPLRFKKLTGTTKNVGETLNIAHGLVGNKIVSINAKVISGTNEGITPATATASGIYFYELSHNATNASIVLGASATSITTKSAIIYITYEE